METRDDRFESDQRVRVSENAFPGSDDANDIAARGQIVTLKYITDESDGEVLWEAEMDDGTIIYPIESELLPPADNA